MRTLRERFESFYIPEPNSGCWLWTGGGTPFGHGQISIKGKTRLAHRVSWKLHKGPIPEGPGYHGTCVCHKCDTPCCVNPDHLFLGTAADNAKDMIQKGRGKPGVVRGPNHSRTNMNWGDVRAIRKAYQMGMGQRDLARLFPVNRSQISKIVNGHQWKE